MPWKHLGLYIFTLGFPGGSDGKESAGNAGDLGFIPGVGRSREEGHGKSPQYSCLEFEDLCSILMAFLFLVYLQYIAPM